LTPHVPVRAWVVAAALLGGAAWAQEPAARPEFPAGVDLVSVDVSVLGSDGTPVTGLGRESFTVLEDGQPQSIATFEPFVGSEPAPTEAHSAESVPAPRAPAAAPAPEARPGAAPAHFLIVFAEEELSARSADAARRAVERFLDQTVREGERVTILSTAHEAWTSGVWPGHREAMRSWLRNVRGLLVEGENVNPAGIDPEHANGFLENAQTGEPVAADPLDPRSRKRTPQHLLAEGSYGRQSLDTARFLDQVRRLVDAQPAGGGRQALILLSEPFFTEPGVAGMQAFLETCRRAHVAVYPLDPRRFSPSPRTDVSMSNPGDLETTEVLEVPDVESAMTDDVGGAVMAPVTLAAETGGFRIRRSNDPGPELRRVASETRTFYRLGYYPSNTTRDGALRRIEVKLAMPKVTVRARRGYYAVPGPKTQAPASARTTASPTEAPPPEPPTPSPPETGSTTREARYTDLVRAYERGERENALRTLARWEPDEARRASAEALQGGSTVGRGRERLLFEESSILLRTEAGFRQLMAGREDTGEALLDGARRDVEDLPAGPDRMGFERQWVTAVTRFRRARGAFDDALDGVERGEHRLGRGRDLERERGLVYFDRALIERLRAENAHYVLRPTGSLLGHIENRGGPPAAAVGQGAVVGETASASAGRRDPGFTSREDLEDARQRQVVALESRARQSALEAARILRPLARAKPDDEDVRLHLGHALLLGEHTEDAAEELGWVADHAQDEGRRYVALLLLGRIEDEAGRLPAAVERYRAAVALRPSGQAARVALSAALVRTGDRVRAEETVLPLLGAPLEPQDDWLVYQLSAFPELRTTMETLWAGLER